MPRWFAALEAEEERPADVKLPGGGLSVPPPYPCPTCKQTVNFGWDHLDPDGSYRCGR